MFAYDFHLMPNPGQLTAILFSPRDASIVPNIPATWSVVATAPIPANTTLYLDVQGGFDYAFGPWNNDVPTFDYSWTTPAVDIPTGTVITFGNLGLTLPPTVNYGSLTNFSNYTGSINYILLLGGTVNTYVEETNALNYPVFPVAASYACSYTGPVTQELIPGRDIRYAPWPDTPSIILYDTCQRVCDWECQRILLNRAPLARWVCQPIPSSILSCNKTSCSTCCSCGPQPPFLRK